MCIFFFFKQKTAYEMRISDWSSDVCSSDRLTRKKWNEALVEVTAEFQQFAATYRALGWQEALGSSGTNKAIGEICAKMGLTKVAVTAQTMPQVRDQLLRASRIEAIDLPGLSDERRPFIPGGVLVLLAAFAALARKSTRLSSSH